MWSRGPLAGSQLGACSSLLAGYRWPGPNTSHPPPAETTAQGPSTHLPVWPSLRPSSGCGGDMPGVAFHQSDELRYSTHHLPSTTIMGVMGNGSWKDIIDARLTLEGCQEHITFMGSLLVLERSNSCSSCPWPPWSPTHFGLSTSRTLASKLRYHSYICYICMLHLHAGPNHWQADFCTGRAYMEIVFHG